MKVLALMPALYDTSPGQRFRLEQWATYLEKDGFHFTFLPFEDETLHQVIYQPGQYIKKAQLMMQAFIRRLEFLTTTQKFDLVFIYREAAAIGPAVIERLVAQQGLPIIYDFDDPIWMSYRSPTNGFLSRLKWPSKTATICRLAKTVMVGNSLLAQYAKQYTDRVSVVPSTIDMKDYPPKGDHQEQATVTLGWTGSHSTLPFLEDIKTPLQQVTSIYSFRLSVISHTDTYQMEGVPTFSKLWKADTEALDLHDADIGLAPFPNTGWTPWRCHGKILQYMAIGIPTIASPIGIIPDYIQDGVNGFLASTDQEWVEKLSRLIENPNLRREMGLAGRKTVENRYSAAVWVPKLKEILRSAASTTQL
ncbi:glycosyltransferase family 4 protein [Laspinema olomoucense]|uniref:Glycosyltransferase family 4 protein n=1 Tax=Laspinema olomoucense D3b TaxID=2953688 RepID=A0ABT2N1C4_9CYAN|nr:MULTISPECIES: glycosyltransferase family 4 protein [unclassified Laspinema]MCT7972013.1 glycosyltransferase family 4 protein [Laspinema sp. D3d]MCT7976483.1 glycosyltransferase family 4 protein [Laspinema sp. D3b]